MLLDLNMPTAGGFDVMRRLRTCPTCANTPVIIVTSSSHPADREQAAGLGAVDYFLKPDDFEEFLRIGEIVQQALKS